MDNETPAKATISTPFPSMSVVTAKCAKLLKTAQNYQWFIQEKIDGSQLSFLIDPTNTIQFFNKQKNLSLTNKTFERSFTMLSQEKVVEILNKSYIYHSESVCRRKHNVVNYGRTPKFYAIIYDIFDTESNRYLNLDEMITECDRIGLEYVKVVLS